MTKTITKLVTVLMLVLIFLSCSQTSSLAAYITDLNSNASFGVVPGSYDEYWHEMHYADYDGARYALFCLQYDTLSPNGREYEFNSEFYVELNKDMNLYKRMGEYIYFGYSMKHGAGVPYTIEAKKAFCATQQYIWEYTYNNITQDFGYPDRDSWNPSYMSSSIYSNWLNDTDNLYANYHNKSVSFDSQNLPIGIGESKTITDNNSVLSSYETFEKTVNGIKFSHTNGSNDMIITVPADTSTTSATFKSNSNEIYRLMPNGAKFNSREMSSYMYFRFNSVQNMIFSTYVDPEFFQVTTTVQSGNALIKKKTDNGNALANCEFGMYSDENCTNLINSGKTNSSGELSFNKIAPGTFYIKELSVPSGYLLNKTVKKVIITNGSTTTVDFTNIKPTGTFTLTKKNADGTKNLQGVKYRIWSTENNYDKTFTTDANGVIKVEGLKLRNILISRDTNNIAIPTRYESVYIYTKI